MTIKELKELVYEANMELDRRGLIVYTWGNVSQIDRERGIFAIKPSGVPYADLKPEMMVLIDLATGERVDSQYKPSSDTPTHLELYRMVPSPGARTRPIPCTMPWFLKSFPRWPCGLWC